MNSRTSVLPLGFGLSAVLCFAPAGSADDPPPPPPRPAVRVYTNEDLARVHPLRGETGVDSEPAVAPAPPARESRGSSRAAGRRAGGGGGEPARAGATDARGEAYWRREAEKVRDHMRVLLDRADTLRARIAAQDEHRRQSFRQSRRGTSSSGASSDSGAQLQAQLAQVERRMRELEEDLADRARREGALPGWLR
jgi:uncharacterized coiled-coil protein SlyX